jgi:hypothetical protein
MPVPSTIDDLSPTAGSNSPGGGETPKDGDNYIRALSAFIALLRDKLDGTSDTGTITNATFVGTASGLRVPQVAYKAATTSRSSTITVSDDPDLAITLTAGTYAFQMWLPFWATGVSVPGIRLQLAYTGTLNTTISGFTYDGAVNGSQVGAQRAVLTTLYAPTDISTSADGTGADALTYSGTISATTGGVFSLKWAQESTSINATNLGAGAWLMVTKLS